MSLHLRSLYQACNPSYVLDVRDSADRTGGYIDLSDVRGSDPIGDIEATIRLFSPQNPTCHLISGQVGSGKSVELLRLRALLEAHHFQTVYVEASRRLDMGDVEVVDVLLAIACEFSGAMAHWQIEADSPTLAAILDRAQTAMLSSDREISTALPVVSRSSLHAQLAQCVERMRANPLLRMQLRQFFDAQLPTIAAAIAQDLVAFSVERLRDRGIENVVILVDNLDRLTCTAKTWGRLQGEYLFVDRGEWLQALGCHVIYTLPIQLLFSKEIGSLRARFPTDPLVLPLIPLYRRDRQIDLPSLDCLRQVALSRMFPATPPEQRGDRLGECCEVAALNLLCLASGGHLRNLLRLLHRWIEQEQRLPLSQAGLQATIAERQAQIRRSLSARDRNALKPIQANHTRLQDIPPDLVRNGLVLEYRDRDGSWFTPHPLLSATQEELVRNAAIVA